MRNMKNQISSPILSVLYCSVLSIAHLTLTLTLTCLLLVHPNRGCGKIQAHIHGYMMTPEKAAALVTGTTLRTTGPVPADSRQ